MMPGITLQAERHGFAKGLASMRPRHDAGDYSPSGRPCSAGVAGSIFEGLPENDKGIAFCRPISAITMM
jgi:hypothetical protein